LTPVVRGATPKYPESRGDPKKYLDDVRERFAQIARQSPEMGEEGWWRPRRRYQALETEPISSATDAAQLTHDLGQGAEEGAASPSP
jgi:hypothetical protein